MKTHRLAPDLSRGVCLPLLLALLASAAVSFAAETKDHTLFVGADFAIPRDGEYFRVVGATHKAFKIEVNHKPREIVFRDAANIRITKGVKLTTRVATIANLTTETNRIADGRAQLKAMQDSMMLRDEAEMQRDRVQGALASSGFKGGSNIPDARDDPSGISAESKAMTQFINSQGGIDANLASSSTLFEGKIQSATDAIDIAFDLSAPQPLSHPYLIAVVAYTVPDKPDETARQISGQSLASIDAKPIKVRLSQEVPSGYHVKQVRLALYADGQEVATNLSENRVSLTKDQAYQYFFIDYLTLHKGETRPPAALLMTPRYALRTGANLAELNRVVYATVDKQGAVLTLSADEAGTEKAPTYVASTLENFRFIPALDKGQPVEGRAKLNLAELIQ